MAELHRQGKIIVSCSAKGGVGISSVTASLALQFSRDPNLKVVLLDYDIPTAGDSLFYVGKLGDTKIRDLVSIDKKVTPDQFIASLPVLPSGLLVLPVTLKAQAASKLPEDKLGKALDIMRRHLDYIFVDVGSDMNDHVLEFMDRASLIMVFANPDRLSLYQTKRYIDYIEGTGLPKHFIRLVLNKTSDRFPLDPRKVEAEMGRPIWSEIPYDNKLELLVLREGSILEQFPQSAASVAIVRLTQSIAFEQVKLEKGDYHGIRQSSRSGVSDQSTMGATQGQSGSFFASNPSITMEMGSTDTTDLRVRVHKKLIREMEEEMRRQGKEGDPEELKQKVRAKVAELVDDDPDGKKLIPKFRTAVVEEILKEALGLGCLEEPLADDSVTEVFVNRFDRIYVEKKGKVVFTDYRFTSEQQLRNIIDRIVAPIGRRCDEKMPLVDARLKDGSRVNAVIPPLAIDGSNITIRKFSKDPLTVADLVRFGAFTTQMGQFMDACVKSRKNIIVSGGTGSGKTTLLNVLSSFIPEDDRIITVEDVAELKLRQPHVVRLETRPPSIEGTGEITIRDLVKNCLRMRPDRIVVGECRSGEAIDMLQAMNTGHDGSLTTVHANTPRDAMSRLETMCLMSGIDLPARAIREQIAAAIQVVVQQARLSDGSRKVTAISELTGYQNDIFAMQDIFVFRQTGLTADGKVIGHHQPTGNIPTFYEELAQKGLPVNREIFIHQTVSEAPMDLTSFINQVGLWAVLLLSFAIVLAAIWFAYEPVAAVCRARLLKDATVMQKIMEASFVPMSIEQAAQVLARIFWGGVALWFLLSLAYGKPNIFIAMVIGMLAYIAANVWVKRQTQQRLDVFEQQLPDVLTLMSNTLKSGLTLQQALDICAREMSKPASHEFFLVQQEIRVGATPEDALQHLAERMPLQEIEMLVTTVATLRQAGGNLTESFETIARVIKERNAVKGKIKALTAQAMFQGKLLTFLPFIFMALLYVTSKEFIMPLFIDPIGWALLVGIILMVSFGYWVMTKLVAIDV